MPRRSENDLVVQYIRDKVYETAREIAAYHDRDSDEYLRSILMKHSRAIVSRIDKMIARRYEAEKTSQES